MKDIVSLLTKQNKTISTMESCTGGAVASSITSIEGASEVIMFSAVTYSNEYKIKMGVNKDIIDKYTVYSMNVADEMSKCITNFTHSNYGVGITGQLNRFDPHNPVSENNIVYISIYDRDNNKFYNNKIKVKKASREDNKKLIVDLISGMLKAILEESR